MQKFQKPLFWTIIASEASHIFCCVLPTIFSVASLMAGIGIIGVVPGWLEDVHAVLHAWEVPLILFSGSVVALGWFVDFYSRKIDCHDTGCGHGPCGPKKKTSHFILKAATVLFFVNVLIWGVFHKGMHVFAPQPVVSEHAEHAHES